MAPDDFPDVGDRLDDVLEALAAIELHVAEVEGRQIRESTLDSLHHDRGDFGGCRLDDRIDHRLDDDGDELIEIRARSASCRCP